MVFSLIILILILLQSSDFRKRRHMGRSKKNALISDVKRLVTFLCSASCSPGNKHMNHQIFNLYLENTISVCHLLVLHQFL